MEFSTDALAAMFLEWVHGSKTKTEEVQVWGRRREICMAFQQLSKLDVDGVAPSDDTLNSLTAHVILADVWGLLCLQSHHRPVCVRHA